MPFQQVIARKKSETLSLSQLSWPSNQDEDINIKVIAPHPDDFDAIAVSLQLFKKLKSLCAKRWQQGGSRRIL